MSQPPPTGPSGASDDDVPRTPATPEEAGGEPTESFERSPYDVPEGEPGDEAFAAPSYGRAPDPSRTIYAGAGATGPESADPAGRRRWVVPVVVVVIVLLVAGAVAAALLLGDDDDEPGPVTAPATAEETTAPEGTASPGQTSPGQPQTPGATGDPTEGPTEGQTSPQVTEQPTDEATPELPGALEESVPAGDLTFALTEDGFQPADVDGATEAVQGQYVSGDEEIELLATFWPSNEAAEEYAAELVDAVDGEEIDSGDTYTNEMGTFWAFVLEDGRGRYVWTTDRGHVLQVTGSTDYVTDFYTSFPL